MKKGHKKSEELLGQQAIFACRHDPQILQQISDVQPKHRSASEHQAKEVKVCTPLYAWNYVAVAQYTRRLLFRAIQDQELQHTLPK